MTTETIPPQGEKLQKILAGAGLGSRREVERWISEGRISVNGETATLGDRATAEDRIAVDGRLVKLDTYASKLRRVIAYNKPEGEVCSRHDPDGHPTVFDKLPKLEGERWVAIGRLDINTTGLMLFTTDGELASRLMHPSYQVEREYAVRVMGEVNERKIKNLVHGIELEDGPAHFTDVVDSGGTGINRWFHVCLLEGRNREVRRLWESQDLKVSRLKRVRFANIIIPNHLRTGQWEEIDKPEIDALSAAVDLAPAANIPTQRPDARRTKTGLKGSRKKTATNSGKKRTFPHKKTGTFKKNR